MTWWRNLSRATRTMILMGGLLVLLAASGVLRADAGLEVDADQAVQIARQQVDFNPENVQVRLVRQGFGLRPVWAVSLSIPGPQTNTYLRLTTVEVDARTGDVLRVASGS
jgi:hypothetical protein